MNFYLVKMASVRKANFNDNEKGIAKYIVNYLIKNFNATTEGAVAAAGNIYQESSYVITVVNSIGATGLCQWLGNRKTKLKAYATSKGQSWTNIDIQLGFLIKELSTTESSTGNLIKTSKNLDEITVYWGHRFERFYAKSYSYLKALKNPTTKQKNAIIDYENRLRFAHAIYEGITSGNWTSTYNPANSTYNSTSYSSGGGSSSSNNYSSQAPTTTSAPTKGAEVALQEALDNKVKVKDERKEESNVLDNLLKTLNVSVSDYNKLKAENTSNTDTLENFSVPIEFLFS